MKGPRREPKRYRAPPTAEQREAHRVLDRTAGEGAVWGDRSGLDQRVDNWRRRTVERAREDGRDPLGIAETWLQRFIGVGLVVIAMLLILLAI